MTGMHREDRTQVQRKKTKSLPLLGHDNIFNVTKCGIDYSSKFFSLENTLKNIFFYF
jgi:hypothetical protein